MTPGVAVVIVDAENVRRSLRPNPSRAELVERARAWARRERHELLIVFDGAPPEEAPDLVGAAHADDAVVRLAHEPADEVWVVTSDRGLRGRLGTVARLVGGGTFARQL